VQSNRKASPAGRTPFPEWRDLRAELLAEDECLQNLREKVKQEADAASIARDVAPLYLDLIARLCAFNRQLDVAMGYQLFREDLELQDNVRRARPALRLFEKMVCLMIKAIDGFLRCHGGVNAIGAIAVGEWAGKKSANGPTDSTKTEEVDRMVKIFMERAKKNSP
jgi:hypothetical protein